MKKTNAEVGDLYNSITKRINERYHKELVTALKFLQGLPLTSVPEFEKSFKSQMIMIITNHGVRSTQDFSKNNGGQVVDHIEPESSSMSEESESIIKEF